MVSNRLIRDFLDIDIMGNSQEGNCCPRGLIAGILRIVQDGETSSGRLGTGHKPKERVSLIG